MPGWSPPESTRARSACPRQTTTTHKTQADLRGMVILNRMTRGRQEDQFGGVPRFQGGPMMHIIAAKAVASKRGAATRVQGPTPRTSSGNARALSASWTERGLAIVSAALTATSALVDLRPKKATGIAAEKVLDRAGYHREQEQHPLAIRRNSP